MVLEVITLLNGTAKSLLNRLKEIEKLVTRAGWEGPWTLQGQLAVKYAPMNLRRRWGMCQFSVRHSGAFCHFHPKNLSYRFAIFRSVPLSDLTAAWMRCKDDVIYTAKQISRIQIRRVSHVSSSILACVRQPPLYYNSLEKQAYICEWKASARFRRSPSGFERAFDGGEAGWRQYIYAT